LWAKRNFVPLLPINRASARKAFEPNAIREMAFVIKNVCQKLDLRLTDNPGTRLATSKIIELGVRDASTLSTLKEIKHYRYCINRKSWDAAGTVQLAQMFLEERRI
jgi:hypothetical protein